MYIHRMHPVIVLILAAVEAVHLSADVTIAPLRIRLPLESSNAVRVQGFILAGAEELTPFEPSWSASTEAKGSVITIREGCDPKKTFVIETDDRMAFVKPGDCSAIQSLDLVSAMNVPLVVEDIKAPFLARIDVLSCTSTRDSGTLLGHFQLTGDANGNGVLRLPATCVQPQIRVAGFAPHRAGNLDLRVQKPPEPVRVQLRRGGSVAAQIITSSMEPVPGVDVPSMLARRGTALVARRHSPPLRCAARAMRMGGCSSTACDRARCTCTPGPSSGFRKPRRRTR